MERTARPRFNAQIYEEASQWLVEFRAGEIEASARREFDAWLRRSPEHLSAYLEVAAIWNEGPSLDAVGKWNSETLIRQADSESNVVALTDGPVEPVRAESSNVANRRSASMRITIAASVVLVSIFGLALLWWQLTQPPTYVTATGEQRSIALPDGSTVLLNSGSRIEVRYSDRERGIDLLGGQALFKVAREAARPFVVTTDSTRVRAVGTQFDVYRRSDATIVTVIEGRVLTARRGEGRTSVQVSSSTPHSFLLVAGEQAEVTEAAVRKASSPNPAAATAWTHRRLVFEDASLSTVAEEFNRYNKRPLVIDGEFDDFHITGVFSSTDPSSLVRFLRERPGLTVVETPDEIRVTKNSP